VILNSIKLIRSDILDSRTIVRNLFKSQSHFNLEFKIGDLRFMSVSKYRIPPIVNFINVKHARFSYKCHFGSFFYVRTYVEKSCQNDVRMKNVHVKC